MEAKSLLHNETSHSNANRAAAGTTSSLHTRYLILLLALFLCSLPMINPWVRGDGVGYYAYVRALLIDHNLHFDKDWLSANPSFQINRVDAQGNLNAAQFSGTGYVRNHFSVGPAILWAPPLLVVHGAVLLADRFGAHVTADGYSRPYLITMGLTTATYGFFGLLLAFDLARRYFGETCALLATLGIWLASSLPVYMYFNPSWSHAHSAFTVALFLWYWQRTRGRKTSAQWLLLGLLAGLMINVYYPNAILMLVPALEGVAQYGSALKKRNSKPHEILRLLAMHALFVVTTALSLWPTLLTRWILYGNPFESDYVALRDWNWTSPNFAAVLFSANHGLISWTPIILPAILGLFLFWRRDPLFAGGLLLSLAAYYYFISSYPDWDGISSFGNRFFVSLTPLFVIGLAASLSFFVSLFHRTKIGIAVASAFLAMLVLWNAGLVFQWGTQMIPARGAIQWDEAIRNQYTAVPSRISTGLETYFLHRGAMMHRFEQQDFDRLQRDSQ